MNLKVGQMWRHLKRGSLYSIVAVGVKIQCSYYPAIEETTGGMSWVVYEDAHATPTKSYTRLETEFLDGRFELVEDMP